MRRPEQSHASLEKELNLIEKTHGTDLVDAPAAVKRRARMIKNRLSAKKSREQAREYVAKLEQTVKVLSAESELLARRLAQVEAENRRMKHSGDSSSSSSSHTSAGRADDATTEEKGQTAEPAAGCAPSPHGGLVSLGRVNGRHHPVDGRPPPAPAPPRTRNKRAPAHQARLAQVSAERKEGEAQGARPGQDQALDAPAAPDAGPAQSGSGRHDGWLAGGSDAVICPPTDNIGKEPAGDACSWGDITPMEGAEEGGGGGDVFDMFFDDTDMGDFLGASSSGRRDTWRVCGGDAAGAQGSAPQDGSLGAVGEAGQAEEVHSWSYRAKQF
eukprot:CAMPEP_0206245700 /NCGR_PEP_ID=MMETSP0047_2-20121206/18839_1 /ASSEMBLY_ACC=CAM_ASM_000192 /TAXON_ID=195065 /ORGANISM="Chroomonas mesostigmatica_cf, Strain CCMP1168" /LENGTH=327 /DNA_ID=CAMNT_0053671021 /DNA_START=172 /DNA_END=1156 /DNA_ORIENTATION=+